MEVAAYGSLLTFDDGTSVSLSRRERPHLVFGEGDASRRPLALATSAEARGAGDRSFTLVQALR